MELANGIEDGIKYKVYLSAPNWIAEVICPDGQIISESWQWAHEPICGPDVYDTGKAEEILDKLINKAKNQEQIVESLCG